MGLLRKLQNIEYFTDLRLVGGTSLALQFGHRKSIDLDLFGQFALTADELMDVLTSVGNVISLNHTPNIHQYSIENIKVDIVNYPYRWLDNAIEIDNLRIAAIKDIGAMKLAAITGRGTRKDFIDLYFLLQYFTLTQLIDFFKQKYTDGSVFLVLKSLTYFQDAETERDYPEMLIEISWEQVKLRIIEEFNKYNELF